MTTLHVREDALRAAVAPFSSVADLRVHPDFPHEMRIEVDRAHARSRRSRSATATLAATGSGLCSAASSPTRTCR